jgi:hypothetical protein
MADYLSFHSPIKVWKVGNRFVVDIELIEIILNVSESKHPKQFKKLNKLFSDRAEDLPPFITYNKNKEE